MKKSIEVGKTYEFYCDEAEEFPRLENGDRVTVVQDLGINRLGRNEYLVLAKLCVFKEELEDIHE